MFKRTLPFLVAGLVVLAGCRNNHENQWETDTGSPQPGTQRTAYQPQAGGGAAPGDHNEKQVRGCLSGANEMFTLTDERTGTPYIIEANENPESKPASGVVFDQLKQHAGQMVQATGNRVDYPGEGAPRFEVTGIERVADACPPNLMGAVNELNRTPNVKVGMKQAEVREVERGSMKVTTPPATLPPVNPAH